MNRRYRLHTAEWNAAVKARRERQTPEEKAHRLKVHKAWYERTRSSRKVYLARYRKKNKERIRAARKAKREAEKAAGINRNKEYYQAHKKEMQAYRNAKRAKRTMAERMRDKLYRRERYRLKHPLERRVCPVCGAEFEQVKKRTQIYCSAKCRIAMQVARARAKKLALQGSETAIDKGRAELGTPSEAGV